MSGNLPAEIAERLSDSPLTRAEREERDAREALLPRGASRALKPSADFERRYRRRWLEKDPG